MTTYESSAKAVAKSSEQVYSQISNLKNLAKFQEKIEATGQVSNLTMTDDEISFDVSMAGKISLQIAETVPGDYVKYQLKSVLKDAELKIKVYAKDENASEIQ
ncbi:MAG: hypothetical protein LBV31_03530, partial [Prevotellaceae bacterium]|nr:hypothetical protein [Prevotellaceae bacterium]